MIQVENLTKQYTLSKKQQKEFGKKESKVTAVDHISFTCQPGRVFTLLGPNGAGKTTTLRMLATILKPNSGSIHIAGINAMEQPKKARKKIGFLTGSTELYARLTPDEVVAYFAHLHRVPKDVFLERKEKLYQLFGVHEFHNKQIGKLSTGMKQKVSICRTMIHDPEVVIFDEPTSGLDVISAQSIIHLIKDCKEKNKTVIFSSHIMDEVDLLSDDLAIIHKGKMLFNDTFKAFKEQAKSDSLTEEFIRIVQSKEKAQ